MDKEQAEQAMNQMLYLLPSVLAWIDGYIDAHAREAVPVADRDLPRLKKYFSIERLKSSKVVLVDRVQLPPLSLMGLPQFADFEKKEYSGVTYKDTFFLAPVAHSSEATHFHELVHIVQWDVLGPEQFLAVYAVGLLASGYRSSPLERMAYELEATFEKGVFIPELESRIREETLSIVQIFG